MLDYERLVQQVADLNVELALLKGRHQNRYEEELRWDAIENQPEIGTLTEEKRLRRIIRQNPCPINRASEPIRHREQ